MKNKWIWMPHAGHFICGYRCAFKLNTYVGKYIVSTVGEMLSSDLHGEYKKVGCDRMYETMVFKARKSKNKCCPYEMISGQDIDFASYNTPEEAYVGHLEMCRKWDAK